MTRKHQIRNGHDINVLFLYGSYLLREGYANEQFSNSKLYKKYEITSDTNQIDSMINQIKNQDIPFIEIDDNFSYEEEYDLEEIDDAIDHFNEKMENIYSSKTPFEL